MDEDGDEDEDEDRDMERGDNPTLNIVGYISTFYIIRPKFQHLGFKFAYFVRVALQIQEKLAKMRSSPEAPHSLSEDQDPLGPSKTGRLGWVLPVVSGSHDGPQEADDAAQRRESDPI